MNEPERAEFDEPTWSTVLARLRSAALDARPVAGHPGRVLLVGPDDAAASAIPDAAAGFAGNPIALALSGWPLALAGFTDPAGVPNWLDRPSWYLVAVDDQATPAQ